MSEPVILDLREQRVVGVLIEKSLATPNYYPLTLNQVVTGCNQKSNREPVVSWMEDEVDETLTILAGRGFATQVHAAGSRVGKWRQELTKVLELDGRAMAVLAEFLLRGPQTLGELRTRASRMKEIPDLAALDEVLQTMAQHDPPLAARFSPEGVKRGVRWGHLLQDPEQVSALKKAEASGVTVNPATTNTSDTVTVTPVASKEKELRLDQLEEMVRSLHDRVQELERKASL
ncbi:MAG: DUF480 domain-containing protein [Planctomycetota bacterium]